MTQLKYQNFLITSIRVTNLAIKIPQGWDCLILHWEIEARQEDDDVIIQINTNNNSIYLEEKDV